VNSTIIVKVIISQKKIVVQPLFFSQVNYLTFQLTPSVKTGGCYTKSVETGFLWQTTVSTVVNPCASHGVEPRRRKGALPGVVVEPDDVPNLSLHPEYRMALKAQRSRQRRGNECSTI
jgi:hypothetical protein